MEKERTHTTAIKQVDRSVYILREYTMCIEKGQQSQRDMTQRCRIEHVQQVISTLSHASHTIWPNDHVSVEMQRMLIGITRTATRKSVTAREQMRQLAGKWSFLVVQMAIITAMLTSAVSRVKSPRSTTKTTILSEKTAACIALGGVPVQLVMLGPVELSPWYLSISIPGQSPMSTWRQKLSLTQGDIALSQQSS